MMTFKKLRNMTGLTKTQFAKKYSIPYRTIQNWELEISKPPEYVLNLLEIAVKQDFPQQQ